MKFNKLNKILLSYWNIRKANDKPMIKIKTKSLLFHNNIFYISLSLYYHDYAPQEGKCIIKEELVMQLEQDGSFYATHPTKSIYTILKSEKGERRFDANWNCWYNQPTIKYTDKEKELEILIKLDEELRNLL